ncbi:MAG: VaFE repeat-containing surface-anchored protein [Eisenbergiella sp.]
MTAEAEFVPESAAGTVTLTYELDSSALAGETIVVLRI